MDDPKAFYDTVCKTAAEAARKVDPELSVAVVVEKRKQGDRLVLAFTHGTNPKIHWNQLLSEDRTYTVDGMAVAIAAYAKEAEKNN